jgi:poly(hydroxyalkanoate) granule-associated protein
MFLSQPKEMTMATKKVVKKVARPAPVAVDTARDVLYASIGAVSLTGKEAQKLVGGLIEDSQQLGQRTLKLVESTVNDVRQQVLGVVEKVQDGAAQNLAQVESVAQAQVSKVLARLGIPSKSDVAVLSRRVSDLSRQVKALQGARKAA